MVDVNQDHQEGPLNLDPICRKCVNLIDCPFDCDPWAKSKGYRESEWCDRAKEAVNGTGKSYEVPISHISNASRLEAKKMNWGHPLVEANIPMINKIVILLIERYATKAREDICETLNVSQRHYYRLLAERKERELKDTHSASED